MRPGDVGYDLTSTRDIVIKPNSDALVSTGLSIVKMPYGCYGRIAPRSGLALKFKLNIHAGVIDPNYKGELKILLFNHSRNDINIQRGTRAAQLILERFAPARVRECTIDSTTTVGNLTRGTQGFGSSG